ncbi:KH domain-containing protein [Candidatus Saccharibacteria bacterium]|nr:MAG: KH domain-containing protein [Candidatus Saccharibacteria bacterium]
MSSNIDQDFVEFVVKSLVGNPDAVTIDRRVDEKGVLLELTVDPEDLGRIIGKRGATAQSLRTLLRALGTKNEARYNLKIVDNGPEDYQKPARDDATAAAPATSSAQDDTDDDDVQAENAEQEAEVAEADETPEQDDDDQDTSSDMAKKHRRDLEDLDDLDI